MDLEALRPVAARARLRLLRMHYESQIGHIGGNLSCLDAMLLLHLRVLGADDRFVLSKGHSAGALYIALWAAGKLDEAELLTFHKDGTQLAGHPCAGWSPDIAFSTGSLGHGLSLAAGLALSKRMLGQPGRVYCLMSDGEWQEGSTWEALIFAAHHKLGNLTALIDLNGLQGFGDTQSVASMGALARRLRAFDVDVREADGHDLASLDAALAAPPDRPSVVVMRTVKGHGVSFMENRMEWHYLPLTAELYEQAVKEAMA